MADTTLQSIAFFTIFGSKNIVYGENSDVTPPPTSEPEYGSMTLDILNESIISFSFGGYNLTGKLDASHSISERQDMDTYYGLTVNGDSGSFSASSILRGTYTQFISIGGTLKRISTVNLSVDIAT